jgi:hypothetical protein
MLPDAVDFLKDSPYPFGGASGKAPGNGQLNNFFRRTRNICQNGNHHDDQKQC